MSKSGPIVIAHRGASGYLPEHSLESKAMAHAMGADFLEQDVVLTSDGVPIVLHDIHLDSTTDVARLFPGRAREDGRYYALDFNLQEIKALSLHERSFTNDSGEEQAFYPRRFPLDQGSFRLPTLKEEISLIHGLNLSREKKAGLYVELKSPLWHQQQGYDIATAVLGALAETGYATKVDQVFLQCFNDQTLIALREVTPLPLIQLIGENDWGEEGEIDYEAMQTAAGLARIANYAQGIGPWIPQVLTHRDAGLEPTPLTALAHEHGLQVHPYTLRIDELPEGAENAAELHQALFEKAGVDGLFTDFPDITRRYLQAR